MSLVRRFRIRAATLVSICLIVLPAVLTELPGVRADVGRRYSVYQTAVTTQGTPGGWDGQYGNGGTHFDISLAVGSSYVMEILHDKGEIFSKTGSILESAFDLGRLSNYQGCHGIDDGRAVYDPSSTRWFIVSIFDVKDCSNPSNASHYVELWVSPTSDPTTPFMFLPNYFAQYHAIGPSSQNDITDHPEMAVTSDKVVISSGDGRSDARMIAYNKADLLNHVNHPYPLPVPSPDCVGQPYPVASPGSTPAQYMVCMGPPYTNSSTAMNDFFLFNITGTGGSNLSVSPQGHLPKITTVIQPPHDASGGDKFSVPANPSPNSREFIGDDWYQTYISAAWNAGRLWFSTTAGCTSARTQNCIRLTQVYAAVNNTPSQDFLFSLPDRDVYMPMLSIDSQGDLSLAFGYSSYNQSIYPSFGITGQSTSDPGRSWIQWKTLKQGTYSGVIDSTSHYADFFGSALDPTDPTIAWIAGGYWPGANNWSTWVASMRVVGLNLTSNSFSDNLGLQASTTVYVRAIGGFSGNVTLSVLDSSGVPTSISLSSLNLVVGGSGTSIVTVSSSSSNCPIPNCSFFLEIGASTQLPGLQSPFVQLFIPFTISLFDFSMSISPGSFSMSALYSYDVSSTSTLTLTLTAASTETNSTSFTVTGQPGYMQVSFSPTSVYPASSGSSVTVTFTIPAGQRIITTQTYTLTITATGFARSHTSTVSITVYPDCTPKICYGGPSP